MGLLGHGVLFTDDAARVTDANDVARSLLDAADGLSSVGGVLSARNASAQGALRAAIARSANSATSTTVLIPRTHVGSFYLVDVIGAASGAKRVVMLLIRDPSAQRPSRCQLLQQAHGLTPAEARVADALADGLSPETIAEQFEVTRGTVKNQLKQVFAKVGVNRQAELVNVIGALAPLDHD